MASKLIESLSKWNWTIFIVVLAVSLMGAMANQNFTSIKEALVFGSSIGGSIGLFMAWFTKPE
jgi:hypothetical protein